MPNFNSLRHLRALCASAVSVIEPSSPLDDLPECRNKLRPKARLRRLRKLTALGSRCRDIVTAFTRCRPARSSSSTTKTSHSLPSRSLTHDLSWKQHNASSSASHRGSSKTGAGPSFAHRQHVGCPTIWMPRCDNAPRSPKVFSLGVKFNGRPLHIKTSHSQLAPCQARCPTISCRTQCSAPRFEHSARYAPLVPQPDLLLMTTSLFASFTNIFDYPHTWTQINSFSYICQAVYE